jgi:signal transduction histidine kinase
LRYRLGRRLESAGLMLLWRVDDLPNWPVGHREGAMRHLQFALFELVSNVLQHAHATTLDVSATASATAIDMAIADDGRGMPAGNTLRSVELRVGAIGGELTIDTHDRGTRVRIRLPLAEIDLTA